MSAAGGRRRAKRLLRVVKIFVPFLVLFTLQGMLYTGHRGFDWFGIALIAPSGAAIVTLFWLRKFSESRTGD